MGSLPNMIPIIAIANLINGIISALLTARLYARHSQDVRLKRASAGVRYFIAFYACLTAMWFLYATPGLLVSDPYLIMVLQSAADVLVYVESIIAVQIAAFALNRRGVGIVIAIGMTTSALIYILGRMLNPRPHISTIMSPYIYWRADLPGWLPLMTGLVAALSSIIFISTFMILSWRARDNIEVFHRSLCLAGGMFLLFAASLTFFVFSTGGFIPTMIASLLGITGLLITLRGISHHTEPSTTTL
jgi:hypothetical protein